MKIDSIKTPEDLLEVLILCSKDHIERLEEEITRLKFIEKKSISHTIVSYMCELNCANKYLDLFNRIMKDFRQEED